MKTETIRGIIFTLVIITLVTLVVIASPVV